MSRLTNSLAAAAVAGSVAAAVLVPGGPAGSATSCVAWAALPSHVKLAGQQVDVRVTLHGTPACRGVTADGGGTGTLNGPGPSTSDFPLQWDHLGATDTAPFNASLNAIGTYVIADGDLQTYNAEYMHIPFEWRTTQTLVKYAGRFAHVSVGDGVVTATLRYYAKYGWQSHGDVVVHLQRHTADGWQTVATHRSASDGHVSFGLAGNAADYRLVSATTGAVWSARALLANRG